jgi:hypothetical protein
MAGHLCMGSPSNLALGSVEMQMQLAASDIFQLLSMPVSQ